MAKIQRKAFTVMELLVVIFIIGVIYFGVIATALAFWTQRNLDFWLTYHAGTPKHSPFLLDYLIGVFSPLAITGNIVSEIVRLFL